MVCNLIIIILIIMFNMSSSFFGINIFLTNQFCLSFLLEELVLSTCPMRSVGCRRTHFV